MEQADRDDLDLQVVENMTARELQIAANSLEEKHRRQLETILAENPTVSEVLDLLADICSRHGLDRGGRATDAGCLWWAAQVHIYHAARLIEMAGL